MEMKKKMMMKMRRKKSTRRRIRREKRRYKDRVSGHRLEFEEAEEDQEHRRTQ